jgi:general secretion pathway protein N
VIAARSPAAAQARPSAPAVVAAAETQAIPEYRQVLARPLFSPWRRPPEMRAAVPQPQPKKVAAAPVKVPPKLAKGQVLLLGVVIDGGREVALIRSQRDPAVLRLSVGDELDGWRLSEITPRSIALEQEGVVEEVLLRDTEAAGAAGRRPIRAHRPANAPQPVVKRGKVLPRQQLRQGPADNRLTRFRQLDAGKGRQPIRRGQPNQ